MANGYSLIASLKLLVLLVDSHTKPHQNLGTTIRQFPSNCSELPLEASYTFLRSIQTFSNL